MIAAIELAMLATLRAASVTKLVPWTWGSLETYPEDWDSHLQDNHGLISAPAAWIVWRGARPAQGVESRNPQHEHVFGVVVMAENSRSEQDTRHGDGVTTGSYALAQAVAQVLTGQSLGPDLPALKVGAIRHVRPPLALQQKKVSMLYVEFSCSFGLHERPVAASPALDDLSTLHINYDIAAGKQAAAPLPDDADADATDHIEGLEIL
jgi:phage gp37-like protein